MKIKLLAIPTAAALLLGSAVMAGEPDGPGRGPRGPKPMGPPPHVRMDERGPGGPRGPRHDRGPGRDDRGPGRHHRGFDRDGGPHMMMIPPHIMNELDITPAQKQQFITVMTDNFRAGLENRMALMEARKQLRELERSDSINDAAYIEASKAVGEAEGKLSLQRRKHRDALMSILTDEQKQKMEKFRAERGPRFGRDRDDDDDPDFDDRGPGRRGGRWDRDDRRGPMGPRYPRP